MEVMSLHNPVFATYVLAASIMVLKAVSMSWLTVVRMMQARGGFRSPEDIRKKVDELEDLLAKQPKKEEVQKSVAALTASVDAFKAKEKG